MANILILFLSRFPGEYGKEVTYKTGTTDPSEDPAVVKGYYTSEIAVTYLFGKNPPDLIVPIVSTDAKTVVQERTLRDKNGAPLLDEQGKPVRKLPLPPAFAAQMAAQGCAFSPLDYFRHKVGALCAQSGHETAIREVAIEDSTTSKTQLTALQEVDEIITDWLAAWQSTHPDDTALNAYVDMTGGKRDAAMMLTAALRCLQYKGYQVKNVLYSDLAGAESSVASCTDLYGMFDAVAAVNSFVTCGTATDLRNWYSDGKDHELRELIQAMGKYSDDLTLNNVISTNDNLKAISEKLDRFLSKDKRDDFKADLFYMLADELSRKIPGSDKSNPYPVVLQATEWCADRGLMMQALALVVECLPYQLCLNAHLRFKFDKANQLHTMIQHNDNLKSKEWPCGLVGAYNKTNSYNFLNDMDYTPALHDKIRDLLRRYDIIRDKRNIIFHAEDSQRNQNHIVYTADTLTLTTLKSDLRKFCDEMKNLMDTAVSLTGRPALESEPRDSLSYNEYLEKIIQGTMPDASLVAEEESADPGDRLSDLLSHLWNRMEPGRPYTLDQLHELLLNRVPDYTGVRRYGQKNIKELLEAENFKWQDVEREADAEGRFVFTRPDLRIKEDEFLQLLCDILDECGPVKIDDNSINMRINSKVQAIRREYVGLAGFGYKNWKEFATKHGDELVYTPDNTLARPEKPPEELDEQTLLDALPRELKPEKTYAAGDLIKCAKRIAEANGVVFTSIKKSTPYASWTEFAAAHPQSFRVEGNKVLLPKPRTALAARPTYRTRRAGLRRGNAAWRRGNRRPRGWKR